LFQLASKLKINICNVETNGDRLNTPSMSTPGPSAKSEKFIADEFFRLVKKGRKHLVLEEVLRFQAKGATIPVDLCHLGILWVLDR
jgi:hypothetical protein